MQFPNISVEVEANEALPPCQKDVSTREDKKRGCPAKRQAARKGKKKADPAAIQVLPEKAAAVVPDDDAIRVQHRHLKKVRASGGISI